MKIVFVDLETTGLDPEAHTPIQIAAIACELVSYPADGRRVLEELARFETKIRFKKERATPRALAVNSYDADTWAAEAVHPAEASQSFGRFLEPYRDVEVISKRRGTLYKVAQLAGHNARFDVDFLAAWYRKLGTFMAGSFRPLCTMNLAMIRALESGHGLTPEQFSAPDGFKLSTLCELFGIVVHTPDESALHDANYDVRATLELARCLGLGGASSDV